MILKNKFCGFTKIKVLFCVLLLSSSVSFAQTSSEWFPGDLNIQPFTANLLEARSGFAYLLGQSSLQLNIGITSDLYHQQIEKRIFSLGGDFFTYTRLHGNSEFHFPVETIDYYFGINAGYKVMLPKSEYGMRVRLSHISAHLADGSYDSKIDNWRNYRQPKVYSREFIELIPYYRFDGFRVYTGLTYILHTSPEDFGSGIFQAGFDYYYTNFSGSFSPFAGYDIRLEKFMKYAATNIITAGVKFGQYDKKGFSILYTYTSGKSIHGEYFDINESYSTIGFNLDL